MKEMNGFQYFNMLSDRRNAAVENAWDTYSSVLGVVSVKKRNTGRTAAFCMDAALSLWKGEPVGILDMNGPSYTERVRGILLRDHGITTVVTPIHRWVPSNPFKHHFDERGELLWVEMIAQEKVVCGYTIRMLDIDNDWHPNESF